MALDMAKYRLIFLEEAGDHLAEISRALLGLEKEMANAEAIDTLFRMAHSIKSMAASLGYDSVAELSHRLEDRMEVVRTAGRVADHAELGLLFRGLETLERMISAVGAEEPLPEVDALLLADLEQGGAALEASSSATDRRPDPVGGEPKKVPS
jgi:two-component system chemotaxis sensor kinase CheA